MKRPENNFVRLTMSKAVLWQRDARANPLFVKGLAGATIVALADQAAKFWIVHILRLPERPHRQIEISGIFDLTYVQNTGASFGMLAGGLSSRIVLSAISLLIAGILASWLGRVTRPLAAAGMAFALYSGGYRKRPLDAFEDCFVFHEFGALTRFVEARITA